MILNDIKEYLLVNSLQYFIGQDDIEVQDKVLEQLANRAMYFYSNWRPLFMQESYSINAYTTTLKYTTVGKRILNVQNLFYIEPILTGEQDAVSWNWDYNKDNGLFRIEIQGSYIFELLVAPELSDLDVYNIEFLDLVLALYLQYIGSSRKAFTLSEQPFENDGADIYSAGQELWDKTIEALQTEQGNWYLAIQ